MKRDKSIFSFEAEKADGEEVRKFSGIAAAFGGKPDSYGDVIEKGAFANSLAKGGRNGTGVVMLWNHNSGAPPIGVWDELKETGKGLKVTGTLADTDRGNEVYELMKMGAIQHMSFAYRIIDSEIKPGKGDKPDIRILKEVDIFEVSPVNFPANTRALIDSVKGLTDRINKGELSVRELEEILRDADFSRQDAKTLASLCKNGLRDADPRTRLLETLRSFKL